MDLIQQTAQNLIDRSIESGKEWNPEIGDPVLVSNGESWKIAFYTGYDESTSMFFATPYYNLSFSRGSGVLYRFIKKITPLGEDECIKGA